MIDKQKSIEVNLKQIDNINAYKDSMLYKPTIIKRNAGEFIKIYLKITK